MGQVCAALIGQFHTCAGQFLCSVSILAHLYNGYFGRCVLHNHCVGRFALFQALTLCHVSVFVHRKGHGLGLSGKAVRCSNLFQGVCACRQICQCDTALGCVRSPCDGVVLNLDRSHAVIAVRGFYLGKVCILRCDQFQFCAVQFLCTVDALLADRNAGFQCIEHGDKTGCLIVLVCLALTDFYVLYLAFHHFKCDLGGQFIAVRCNRFFQGILAVRELFQQNCLVAGCPGDDLGASRIAFDLAVFCGYMRQICAALIGQFHICTGQFLCSISVLAHLYDGHFGWCIFHNNSLIILFRQIVYGFDLAVCADHKGHGLSLFGKAVRSSDLFQGVCACRKIGQFYAALCAVGCPANGFAVICDAVRRLVAVSITHLGQVNAVRCSQFQFCAGEFFAAADCLLTNRNRFLDAVLHDDFIIGNVIFLRNGGSLCYLTILYGKGEACAYLIVAVRCSDFFHDIFAVRQTDDVSLVFAV